MATKLSNNSRIQGTEEWLKWRKKHIGGSDIASVMGTSPWKNTHTLWLEKTGRKIKSDPNYYMIRGLDLEDKAREKYVKETENFIVPQTLEYEEWKIACASLDGITQDQDLIVEIKCPGESTIEKCRNNLIDPHYTMQCQWNMMVSKTLNCDFFCYGFGNALMRIRADKKLQKEMLEKAKEFWFHVENDVPPPASENDHILITDEKFQTLANQYRKVMKEIKDLEVHKNRLKLDILDFGDDRNFKGYGLKVTRSHPRKKIDWEKVCKKYKITEIDLKEFIKEGINYWTITFKD